MERLTGDIVTYVRGCTDEDYNMLSFFNKSPVPGHFQLKMLLGEYASKIN